MTATQPHLIDIAPAERAALDERVLVTRRYLNKTTRALIALKDEHKAAKRAHEDALTDWGRAVYGPDWDGNGPPPPDLPHDDDDDAPAGRDDEADEQELLHTLGQLRENAVDVGAALAGGES